MDWSFLEDLHADRATIVLYGLVHRVVGGRRDGQEITPHHMGNLHHPGYLQKIGLHTWRIADHAIVPRFVRATTVAGRGLYGGQRLRLVRLWQYPADDRFGDRWTAHVDSLPQIDQGASYPGLYHGEWEPAEGFQIFDHEYLCRRS